MIRFLMKTVFTMWSIACRDHDIDVYRLCRQIHKQYICETGSSSCTQKYDLMLKR